MAANVWVLTEVLTEEKQLLRMEALTVSKGRNLEAVKCFGLQGRVKTVIRENNTHRPRSIVKLILAGYSYQPCFIPITT